MFTVVGEEDRALGQEAENGIGTRYPPYYRKKCRARARLGKATDNYLLSSYARTIRSVLRSHLMALIHNLDLHYFAWIHNV
jgi:hypothetical protein